MKKTLMALGLFAGVVGCAGTTVAVAAPAAGPLAPVTSGITAIPVLGAPLAGVLADLPVLGSGGAAGTGLPGLGSLTGALSAIPVLGPPLASGLGSLPIPGAGSGSGGGASLPGLDSLTGALSAIPVLGPPLASALGGLPIPGGSGGSGLPGLDSLTGALSAIPVLGPPLASGLGSLPIPGAGSGSGGGSGLPGLGSLTGALGNIPVLGDPLGQTLILLVADLKALPGALQALPGAFTGSGSVDFPLVPNTVNQLTGLAQNPGNVAADPIGAITRVATSGLDPDLTILLLDSYNQNPYNGTSPVAPLTNLILDPLTSALNEPVLILGQGLTSLPLPGSGGGLGGGLGI